MRLTFRFCRRPRGAAERREDDATRRVKNTTSRSEHSHPSSIQGSVQPVVQDTVQVSPIQKLTPSQDTVDKIFIINWKCGLFRPLIYVSGILDYLVAKKSRRFQ